MDWFFIILGAYILIGACHASLVAELACCGHMLRHLLENPHAKDYPRPNVDPWKYLWHVLLWPVSMISWLWFDIRESAAKDKENA